MLIRSFLISASFFITLSSQAFGQYCASIGKQTVFEVGNTASGTVPLADTPANRTTLLGMLGVEVAQRRDERSAMCAAYSSSSFDHSDVSSSCQPNYIGGNYVGIKCEVVKKDTCCIPNSSPLPQYAPTEPTDCKTLGNNWVTKSQGLLEVFRGYDTTCALAVGNANMDNVTAYLAWKGTTCPDISGQQTSILAQAQNNGCYFDAGMERTFIHRPATCCIQKPMPISWTVSMVDANDSVLNEMILFATGTDAWENNDSSFYNYCSPMVSGFRIERYGDKLTFSDIIMSGMPEYKASWNLGSDPVVLIDTNTCTGYDQPSFFTITPNY